MQQFSRTTTNAVLTIQISTGAAFPRIMGAFEADPGVERRFVAESPETPTSNAHVIQESGSWRMGLVIAGDNVKASTYYVRIGFSAEWWAPDSGRTWTHVVRIDGPTSEAPAEPLVAPTAQQMLEAAIDEDAEREG